MTGGLVLATATRADAAAVANVRTRAAEQLTRDYGQGPWSWASTEKSVLRDLKSAVVLAAVADGRVVGTLKLTRTKPWAIDPAYFTAVARPLYLLEMAVEPDMQRHGLGRWLLARARDSARAFPADAIRLDAFDSPAGAAPFYAKCGLTDVGHVVYRGTPLVYFEAVLH